MTDLARRDALRVLSAQALLTGLVSWAAAASSSPPSKATQTAAAPAVTEGATSGPRAEGEPSVPAQPAQHAAASDVFAGGEALTAALGSVPRDAKVIFGVGVVDARTGRRYLHDPSGPFEMASTAKVDLLTAALVRAQRAGRDLTSGERARAATMIQVSDNAAADSFWSANGGATGMRAIWDQLGMGSMQPGPRGRWGLSSTSIEDRLRLLDLLVAGSPAVSSERTAYVLSLMSQVTPTQRWGVGGVARAGETVAVKNGWLPRTTEGSRWIVSTTGRLTGPQTDLRLVALSHGHRTQKAGVTFLEAALAAARQHLGV